MSTGIEIIGLTAGTLTTLSFVPQLVKVYRSRSAKDISWLWIIGFFTGIVLWVIYGLLTASLPIILANVATLVIGFGLAVLKWKDDNAR